MSKFAISGFGRSGTKWLATLLNKSPIWTVMHEPSSNLEPAAIISRFNWADGPYGEVNSLLLPLLHMLPVDNRALLIRHPRDIFLSAVRKGHSPVTLAEHLGCCLQLIDMYYSYTLTCSVYKLEELVDPATRRFQQLLEHLGITDLQFTPEDLTTRVNEGPGEPRTFEQLPEIDRILFYRNCDWFVRKFYPERGV